MRKVQVLIVEDEEDKRRRVVAEISAFFGEDLQLEVSSTLVDATRRLFSKKYDLIVVDLLVPRRAGEEPVDVSEEIIDHLTGSELNRLTTAVAISRFDDVVDRRRGQFVRAGVLLIRYADDEEWRSCLRICMQRVAFRTLYDFVVVCALGSERAAFDGVSWPGFVIGDLVTSAGMDGREMELGPLRGICVLQPQMGLVDASIVATKALDVFAPRLICMSGICGGFKDNVDLGRLVVSDFSWEHQAGKWRGDEFEVRSYHENLQNDVRVALSQLIEEDPDLLSLKSKPYEVEVPNKGAELAPSVSGSAVIASERYVERIGRQHGKVAAIDMEVFGVYRAAALHGKGVKCFAAKTVVDLAGEAKDDLLHKSGALLAARFVVRAVERLLSG